MFPKIQGQFFKIIYRISVVTEKRRSRQLHPPQDEQLTFQFLWVKSICEAFLSLSLHVPARRNNSAIGVTVLYTHFLWISVNQESITSNGLLVLTLFRLGGMAFDARANLK